MDDSNYMNTHTEEVERTFRALAYIAKSADPDGIKVCFSSSPEQQTWLRHTTRAIRLSRSRWNSSQSGSMGMESALNRLLEEIESRGSGPTTRRTTILVLTDTRTVNTALDLEEELGNKFASICNGPLQGCVSVHFTYFGGPVTEANSLRSYRVERYFSEPLGPGWRRRTPRRLSQVFWCCCHW